MNAKIIELNAEKKLSAKSESYLTSVVSSEVLSPLGLGVTQILKPLGVGSSQPFFSSTSQLLFFRERNVPLVTKFLMKSNVNFAKEYGRFNNEDVVFITRERELFPIYKVEENLLLVKNKGERQLVNTERKEKKLIQSQNVTNRNGLMNGMILTRVDY